MIVNFPVEGNRRIAILADNRLIAPRQIDNLQPHRAKCGFAALKYALLIRSAMRNRSQNALRNSLAPVTPEMCKPRNSTHIDVFLVPVGHDPRASTLRWICIEHTTRLTISVTPIFPKCKPLYRHFFGELSHLQPQPANLSDFYLNLYPCPTV